MAATVGNITDKWKITSLNYPKQKLSNTVIRAKDLVIKTYATAFRERAVELSKNRKIKNGEEVTLKNTLDAGLAKALSIYTASGNEEAVKEQAQSDFDSFAKDNL